jgi:hypothetical protein
LEYSKGGIAMKTQKAAQFFKAAFGGPYLFGRGMGAISSLIVSLVTGCGTPSSRLLEAWNPPNDPAHFDAGYQRQFSTLPRSGKAAQQPWSDDYWPSYRGGIAVRWRVGEDGFAYQPPNRNELEHMTLDKRSELSPAEKFDALRGSFDYPTVMSERARTSPQQPAWEGLCHGWAVASMLHKEPKPIILKSSQNIEIPFAASDIKALLTYFHGQESYSSTNFLGTRCNITINGNEDPRAKDPECRDLNAGSFHVVLANELGIKNIAFIGDVMRDLEVWNQPVYSFETEVVQEGLAPSPGAAPDTVQEVLVKTRMEYVLEMSPDWNSQLDREALDSIGSRTYEYRLELDGEGKIIGGEWMGFDRPDFFWRQSKSDFYGRWSSLEDLLLRSLEQAEAPQDPRSQS